MQPDPNRPVQLSTGKGPLCPLLSWVQSLLMSCNSTFQARLPEYRPGSTLSLAELGPDPEMTKEREEIRWVPAMTLDGDLLVFLRAAR